MELRERAEPKKSAKEIARTKGETRGAVMLMLRDMKVNDEENVYNTLKSHDSSTKNRMGQIASSTIQEGKKQLQTWINEFGVAFPSNKTRSKHQAREGEPNASSWHQAKSKAKKKAENKQAAEAVELALDPDDWNEDVFQRKPRTSEKGIFAANATEAEEMVQSGLWKGGQEDGVLTVVLMGGYSDSLIAAAHRSDENFIAETTPMIINGKETSRKFGYGISERTKPIENNRLLPLIGKVKHSPAPWKYKSWRAGVRRLAPRSGQAFGKRITKLIKQRSMTKKTRRMEKQLRYRKASRYRDMP